jgi:hypothetical protein
MMERIDREIEGAAGIYQRAKKWGHLPGAMTFETFVDALRRGDDPYVDACEGRSGENRVVRVRDALQAQERGKTEPRQPRGNRRAPATGVGAASHRPRIALVQSRARRRGAR